MHSRASSSHGVGRAGRAGSEAIALASLSQQKSDSNTAALVTDESAIAHINNARQILSSLHELLGAVGSVDFPSVEDTRGYVVAAARRLAKAVELLTPAPRRPCSNCNTLTRLEADHETLSCAWCGQVERGDRVVVAGAAGGFDPSSLAACQADGYELDGADL